MKAKSNKEIAKAIYLSLKGKSGIELSEILHKVTEYLYKKRLISKANSILRELEKVMNQEEGRVSAKVTSARKLDQENKNQIIHLLRERYKVKEVTLKEILNEKFIGGVRIEAEDEILDNTIKRNLEKLQESLTR